MTTPIKKPKILLLEELKHQLTQPSKNTTQDTNLRFLDKVQDPTQLTSAALSVLLEEEEQPPGENEEREDESTQVRSRTDELALALEVLNLVFRKLKLTRRNLGNQSASANLNTLPPEVLHQIGNAIWAHWNTPSPTISYKIKNALKNLFEYMNSLRIDVSQSSTIQFLLESVKQSVLLEKRSLSILSYLLPHMSLEEALQAFRLYAPGPSEFLGTILGAIGDDKLASVIGQLAVHWTSKVEGWDSRNYSLTELSAQIRTDWISIVFSILFSSEERKRQYLCQYYLLPLFKSRPRCFTELTEILSSTRGPLSIANSLFDYLSGIIALARLNPRQSCKQIEPSQNETDLQPKPWLPDALLKVALSHPAVSLRSSALAIICQTSAPTSRLPRHHLDLILHFFSWNFGEVEAELKQNIFSNLNVLFNRLRDSSHASRKKLPEFLINQSNLSQISRVPPIERRSVNDDHEASQLKDMANEAEAYLEAVQAFVLKFLKLCRRNLTISSPYRCQMASLTYLQILLNTGIDPLYTPPSSTCSRQEVQKQSSFPFEVRIVDQSLIHKLIFALNSTYVDVREASFTLLQHCDALDLQFGENSRLMKQVISYALQCLNSRRESENCTATLLFRLILEKFVVRNAQVPVSLLPRNSDQHKTTNSLAVFLLGRLGDMEDRIRASEINLEKACEEQPTAGSILLISELFKCLSRDMITSLVVSNDLKDIMERTRKLVLRIWRLSAVVLCHSNDRQSDAVPDHEEARAFELISTGDGDLLEEEGVLAGKKHKNRHNSIISACWRSMKEASALLTQTVKLSLIAQEQCMCNNRETFLSYKDLKEIGELFEQWLLEIRHRGAFGAIHASYASLCDSLCTLPNGSTSSQLPFLWLQAHISAITSRQISTTRRSAGLPYCILSACQALSKSSPKELKDSLSSILNLGQSQHISPDVQVHVLNTLKILLTDGKVSFHFSSVFIERSYDLAIKSFVSSDWRVRNGALILFSGLTNRVFGTRSLAFDRSHSNLSRRESLSDFSRRLPTMPSILLNELRRSTQAGVHLVSTSHSHGPIFAVLTLLALLQNPDGAPAALEFLPLVRECLSSKVSKIRSIGADAMTGIIPSTQVPALMCDLLTEATKSRCHNEVHGLLLLINRLIQVPRDMSEDQKTKVRVTLATSAPLFLHSGVMPLVSQSSFLEILEGLESRFGITVDSNRLFSSESLMEKIHELRSVKAPALNSYEIQATRNILRRSQDRETVLRLLKMGSTPTRITVFGFLTEEANRTILNDPEVIDTIFMFGRQATHSISVRLPALKLLAIGSHLNAAKWSLEDLFRDYQSNLAVPMRDTLLVLAGSFLFNSLTARDSNIDNLPWAQTWANTILLQIEEAAQEVQSTETRLSAVEGLTEFLQLFKMRNGILSISIKLRILELLSTLIQDDDDEIRASLIKTLDRTKFLSCVHDGPQPATDQDQDAFQLELLPNLILEKLVHLSISLNPFFGFKKLLKIVDFQADLDQLLKPPDDLFITEKLNLYKDDFLEFELVRRISVEILSDYGPREQLGNHGVEAAKEDHDKVIQVFRECDLEQEIRTFKHLIDIVVPRKLLNRQEGDLVDHTVFENPLNSGEEEEEEGFQVISHKAWFSLVLRLFTLLVIFNSFPLQLKRLVFHQMSALVPSDHHAPLPLDQQLDSLFSYIQGFLRAHYY